MSAFAYPDRGRPSVRYFLTPAAILGMAVLVVAAYNLVATSNVSPDRVLQPPPNAAPINIAVPNGAAPPTADQRPAVAPILPEQVADRAKGILRTGTIPAGLLGANSLDSGDGDVSCGKTECGP